MVADLGLRVCRPKVSTLDAGNNEGVKAGVRTEADGDSDIDADTDTGMLGRERDLTVDIPALISIIVDSAKYVLAAWEDSVGNCISR